MKKLWAASLLAGLAFSPQTMAITHTQAEIEELKKRIFALEEQEDVSETRNYTIGTDMQFGVGSGMYADEIYLIDFGLNRDLSLLHERQYIHNKYKSFENAPHLLISGNISGTVGSNSHLFGVNADGHEQFMKGSAELDFTAMINEDWLGYLEIEADAFGDDTDLGVKQAFTTYGNFEKGPMYLTLGYQYVPFGNFTTNFIESTPVQDLGRIQVPAANGAFNIIDNNWEVNGAVFWFDGRTKTSDEFRLDEVGANLQARVTQLGPHNDISIMMGASVVNNLASSNGIAGFVEEEPLDSTLEHYVPGVDMRAKVAIGPVSVTGEYLLSTRHFAPTDFAQGQFDDLTGAKPSATYVEAAYDYKLWGMPNTLSARYGQTTDALAFGLPFEEFGVSYQLAPFFNTRVTFEYMHKIDYSDTTYYSAGGAAAIAGTDETDDLFQAQINVYF